MNVVNEFETVLYESAEKKIQWYNTFALPGMLENYRTFHSAIRNMIGIFEKKKLLIADPYKKDKRVVDITVPSAEDFPDSEGPATLGIRLSDYESSLDFLCNYKQFTVEALTPENIKKLSLFNSFIDWNNLNRGNHQSNQRYFGGMVYTLKNSNDSLSLGLLNNMLSVVSKTIHDINTELKNLTGLQKQLYKIEVRKNIFDNPSFLSTYNSLSVDNALSEIKKVFPSMMGKKRFYPDLIDEIVQEDFSPSKEQLRSAILETFQIASETKEKEVKTVDTRVILFEVVKILPAFAPTLEVLKQKIQENHELLQSEHKKGFAKFIQTLRGAFGIKEKTVEYKIKCVDMHSQAERFETIEYNKFIEGMGQRIRLFTSLSSRSSPLMVKLEGESEEAVLEYIQKRISDCQSLFGTLSGFDNFFKTEVSSANRNRVKGLKIDLDVIKNTLVKANKQKAEYVSTVTTEQQMKKLGITND